MHVWPVPVRGGRLRPAGILLILVVTAGGGFVLWRAVSARPPADPLVDHAARPVPAHDSGQPPPTFVTPPKSEGVHTDPPAPPRPTPEPSLALQTALATADRIDPNWRFDELLARRPAVTDADNAATVVLAAAKALPDNWPSPAGVRRLALLSPTARLSERDADALRDLLAGTGVALGEARKLDGVWTGRYEFGWPVDYFAPPQPPHLAAVNAVGQLLAFDALRCSRSGDSDGALAASRALLNTGRSLGDEPLLASQLVRAGTHRRATQVLEQTLANGQPGATALLATQRLLEKEAEEPFLLNAACAIRAARHKLMLALQDEELDPRQYAEVPDLGIRDLGETMAAILREAPRDREALRPAHAWLLNYLTEFVEIAKQPSGAERDVRIEKLINQARDAPPGARRLVPPVAEIVQAAQNSQALLRTAAVALAAERYRIDKNRWPQRLEELTPTYLARVRDDPFGGGPLRYKVFSEEHCAVVYSVGRDGVDNGGVVKDLNTYRPGTDLGFRLYNADQRKHE